MLVTIYIIVIHARAYSKYMQYTYLYIYGTYFSGGKEGVEGTPQSHAQ